MSLERKVSRGDTLGKHLSGCLSGLDYGTSSLCVAAPAGLPVLLGTVLTPRLARYSGTAAVPAPAEFPGLLALFLGIAPLVFPAAGIPSPSLVVLLAVLVLATHRACRCSLECTVSAGLVRAAIWLRRTAGYGCPVCPGLRCRTLAGTGCFGAGPFALGRARQGEGELEGSSFHPLRRGLPMQTFPRWNWWRSIPAGAGSTWAKSGSSGRRWECRAAITSSFDENKMGQAPGLSH